jgi:hypothetical protein
MSKPRTHPVVWKRVLLALMTLVALGVLWFGYSLYRAVHVTIPESYAAWTTGNVIVEYLATHTNQWPRSWEELQSAANSMLENGRPVYTPLDRLPQFVKVDWHADIDRLFQIARSDPKAKIHVISRLDGSPLRAAWGPDTEPNAKVMGYLRWSLTTSNQHLQATPR